LPENQAKSRFFHQFFDEKDHLNAGKENSRPASRFLPPQASNLIFFPGLLKMLWMENLFKN
jgi:hypothetical protein